VFRCSKSNTECYSKIFPEFLHTIRTTTGLALSFQVETTPQKLEIAGQIKGHLIEYPIQFLLDSTEVTLINQISTIFQ